MHSQDQKYFYFRYRVIFVAFLLISPATSSAPKQDSASSLPRSSILQCAAIVSALIKDPNGFLKIPDMATIGKGCIESVPDILAMIERVAESSILGAGLFVLSEYLLYESYQLYKRTMGLELNLEKYNEDFELLKEELYIINEFIKKDVEPQWNNGDTVKMLRYIDTVIGKLKSFVDRINELADRIRQDVMQGHGDKMWSVQLPVGSVIVCIGSFFTGTSSLVIPTCAFGACTVFWGFWSHFSLEETLKQLKLLRKDIMKVRKEITKTRGSVEIVKIKIA